VNDAVSEPALVQERERDTDVVEQCALAATNNDRPEEQSLLVDQACRHCLRKRFSPNGRSTRPG
jgi:hypothetical protein